MLLNVHLTPQVLAETSRAVAKFQAPALRREVMELLVRHGVLRFTSADEARAVVDQLKQLPPAEAKEWQSVFLSLNRQGRMRAEKPALLDDLSQLSAQDLRALKELAPVLSLLGEETYMGFFPQADQGLTELLTRVEVAVPGSVGESENYSRVRELLEGGMFPAGTSREDVWVQLLAPLAAVSKEVVLFDRYLFGRPQHLTWLLSRLDQVVPKGASVKLFGARGVPGDYGDELVPYREDEAERAVKDLLGDNYKRIGMVEAVLAPSNRTRDMHHDRHLRFSAGAVIELPAGFDRLGRAALSDDFGFTHRTNPAPYIQREDGVLHAPGTLVVDA